MFPSEIIMLEDGKLLTGSDWIKPQDSAGVADARRRPGGRPTQGGRGVKFLGAADGRPRRPRRVFLRQFFNRGPSKH